MSDFIEIFKLTPRNPRIEISDTKLARFTNWGGVTSHPDGWRLADQYNETNADESYIRIKLNQSFEKDALMTDKGWESQATFFIGFRSDEITDDDEITINFELFSHGKQWVQFFIRTLMDNPDPDAEQKIITKKIELIHYEEVDGRDSIMLPVGLDLEKYRDKTIISKMQEEIDIIVRPTQNTALDFFKVTVNKLK